MTAVTRAATAGAGALGLLAICIASSAQAASIVPGGTFAASAGPTRLVLVSGGTALPINCTSSSLALSINAGAYPPPADVGNVTPSLQSCVGPTGLAVTFTCNAVTPSDLWVILNPIGGSTLGELRGVDCTGTFPLLGCSFRLSGTLDVTYVNPSGATPASVIARVSAVGLATSAGTCPGTLVPPGAVGRLGAPFGSGTGLTNLTYALGGAASTHPVVS